MNWKKFLKPNPKKVTLFVALAPALYFTAFFFGCFFVGAKPIVKLFEPECSYPLDEFLIITLGSPADMIFNYLHVNVIFIDFIYWYLLSCLIIWIYDKVKKK